MLPNSRVYTQTTDKADPRLQLVVDSEVTVSPGRSYTSTCSSQDMVGQRGWEHAARGHRTQTSGETPGETLGKSQDRGRRGVGVGGAATLVALGVKRE